MNTYRKLGPPRKRVVQAPNSQECAVATACMIAGCELADAHKWMGTEPGEQWHDGQVQLFLLNFGITFNMGVGLITPEACTPLDILQLDRPLEGNPGYMSVNGKKCKHCLGSEDVLMHCDYCDSTGYLSHAVYWDGYGVWDPSPYIEEDEPQPLESYKLRDFWPLEVFTEGQTMRLRRALAPLLDRVGIFFEESSTIQYVSE